MVEMEYVQKLNMPVNMTAIISKLSYKISARWKAKAHNLMETIAHGAFSINVITFMERHVSILSDPLIS